MGAVLNRNDSRAIHYAVVASILFHGLLLSLAPRQAAQRPAALPGPIVARLVQPPAPPAAAPAAPQAEPQKPQEQPAKPDPARAEPPPVAKPSPITRPEPRATPKAESAAKPPSAPSPAPAAEPAPAAPIAAPSPGPVAKADPQPAAPSPPAPSVEPSDAGTLAQYRLQLISMAKRYKRYPRVAMDNNWEGDVVVRMVIGTNGMISSISVKTSSGHQVLDKQAVEMFQKAKPLVPIPGALRGKEFAIEVRAIYNLKDPDSG